MFCSRARTACTRYCAQPGVSNVRSGGIISSTSSSLTDVEVDDSTDDTDDSSDVESSGVDESSGGDDLTTGADGLDATSKAVVCAAQKHSGI